MRHGPLNNNNYVEAKLKKKMIDTVPKSEEQEDDILGMRMPLKMRCRAKLK